MGHGTFSYRPRRPIWKPFLATVETLLYLAFIADCFILMAGEGSMPSYLPVGGVSLIPILLLASFVHWLRDGD